MRAAIYKQLGIDKPGSREQLIDVTDDGEWALVSCEQRDDLGGCGDNGDQVTETQTLYYVPTRSRYRQATSWRLELYCYPNPRCVKLGGVTFDLCVTDGWDMVELTTSRSVDNDDQEETSTRLLPLPLMPTRKSCIKSALTTLSVPCLLQQLILDFYCPAHLVDVDDATTDFSYHCSCLQPDCTEEQSEKHRHDF